MAGSSNEFARMDKIRQKAQSLLEKLHDKYGLQSKQHIHLVLGTMGKQEPGISDSLDQWYLVDTHGQKFRLPKTMLFLGRDECDIVVTSQSVDKRHAVLAYDLYLNRFKVKDLSTTNGTYVNNCRIPDQEYVSLNHMDSIRLGQEAMMYHMEQASQITEHGGQLPDPYFIPSWASRARDSPTIHVLPHPLAECQGCIAEQNLEHTCRCRHERLFDDSLHLEELHHLPHHHHSSPHTVRDILREHHQSQGIAPLTSRDPGSVPQVQQFDQVIGQQKDDHADNSQHKTILTEDQILLADIAAGKHSDDPSLARNTCPEKQQMKHENLALNPATSAATSDNPESDDSASKNVQTMFFVSLGNNSDSVCNNSGSTQRADNGTPPYISKYHQSPGDSSGTSTSSPSPGLAFDRGETVRSPTSSAGVTKCGTVESQHMKLSKGSTYMEIPLRDDGSSRDASDSKSSFSVAQNVSSTLTKGSLLDSPHQKQPDEVCEAQSPASEMNSAMSFTIELKDSEHPSTKSLNICSSISQFVPSKMRKSFQGRKTVSSKTSKNAEEDEMTTVQSKVIESSTVVSSHSKSKLTGTSLRPPNLGELNRLSEPTEQNTSLEKKADKKAPLRKPKPNKTHQMSQHPNVTSFSNAKPVPVGSTVSVTDYQHPTNYLIDKMFEGGNTLPAWTGQEHFPEQKQRVKKVVSQDKSGCLSTEKSFVRPVIDSSSYQSAPPKISSTHPVSSHVDDNDLQIIEDFPCEFKEFSEKDDREDKVSEAGTYTIETDLTEGQEEEEARKRIGLVFGIDDIDVEHNLDMADCRSKQPVNGHVTASEDICDDTENTLLDDISHSPEEDADYIIDDLNDEINDVAPANGVPTWVSQLTSLANQKSAASNRLSQEDGAASLSKKPPQGVSRKRPGTGRKLPSIPCDKSPIGHTKSLSGKSLSLVPGDAGEVFTFDVIRRKSLDNISKPGGVSGQQLSRTRTNLYPVSPDRPTGSHNNGDIELPLNGPTTVSSATSHKLNQTKKLSQHAGTNPASASALVNGGNDYATPVLYKSPRDALVKRQQKDLHIKSGPATSTLSASSGKKHSEKLHSPTIPNHKAVTTPRSTPSAGGVKKLSAPDVVSRKDSVDNGSTTSDLSSEPGDGSLPRSSSKSKATITMTRTNKTFDLRRARAGSLDEQPIPRSTKEPPPARSAKPSSLSLKPSATSSSGNTHRSFKGKLSEDTSHNETTACLAAQVAKKSPGSITQVTLRKAGSTVLSRTDSGIHSITQKLQRASSLTITTPGGKIEHSPKSHLKSTSSSRNSLTLRGITNKSHSQPGSRSSSPKAAEKMAWKRRKEYDARKSVAEARTIKTKDISNYSVSMKHKPAENINTDKRMFRSASFTNSLFLQNSASSSQEFIDRRDSNHQHYDLRRSFLPFHTSHHNGMSSNSADEDESIASAASTQDNAKNLVSLLEIPSAFTPPLLRNKPVSPENSSPSEASLTLRRKTLKLDQTSNPSVMKSIVNGDGGDMENSSLRSSQPSYDSLIAASVHQLSQKLTRSTDVMLNKLKEQNQTCHNPSSDDDFLSDSGKSEITGWKTVNQELASTLRNLRMLERHVQIINAALFPDLDTSNEVSPDMPVSQQGKQKLLENIERNLGFQPIDQPHPDETEAASPEMAEISGQFR